MTDASDHIKVLITVKFDAESLASFRNLSERVDILYHPTEHARDISDEIWATTEVLYTSVVLPEPEQVPRLKWVHVHYAGIDHLLNKPLISERSVTLTTSSGIHATNMTEYVFMMMLAFGHRLPTMLNYQADGDWPDEQKFLRFMPVELRGSTVGIVGYGSIGREIARVARAFGMEVLAMKRDVRHPSDPHSYVMPGTGDPDGDYFHRLYPPEALGTMVRDCDFVIVTTPLTESTRLMFDAAAFEAMKPSAYLINVGRGGVVDEVALLKALQSGQIAGAAMDVFASEPLPADSPLWKQRNLIISPHIAGNTGDYNEKAAAMFIENLKRYLAGDTLFNRVDYERGY